MSVNWGIIGTGEIAYELGYAIKHVPTNKLVAVASRQEENARRFANVLGVGKTYQSYENLICDEDLDVIYIAAPNNLHFELIKSCLTNGKHVLCEKPLTLNAKQALEIKEMAYKKGLFCMEALWTRFIPSMQRLQKLIDSNQLGRIKLVEGSFGNIINTAGVTKDNGGVMLDRGVYLISSCIALFGKPDHIEGILNCGNKEVDMQATIQLSYDDGMMANFSCSFVTDLSNDFSVHGENGVAKLSSPFYRSAFIEKEIITSSNPTGPHDNSSIKRNMYKFPGFLKYLPFMKRTLKKVIPKKNIVVPFEGSGYHYQILEVNKCLTQNLVESPVMPLDITIATLEIMDAIRKKFNLNFIDE